MEVLGFDAESGEGRDLVCVWYGGQVLYVFINMNPTITCFLESVISIE